MKCRLCGKELNAKELKYAEVLDSVCAKCTLVYMHELSIEGEVDGVMPCPHYTDSPEPGHNCWETCTLDGKRGQTCIGMLNCKIYQEIGRARCGE